jgi:hypothetical protein
MIQEQIEQVYSKQTIAQEVLAYFLQDPDINEFYEFLCSHLGKDNKAQKFLAGMAIAYDGMPIISLASMLSSSCEGVEKTERICNSLDLLIMAIDKGLLTAEFHKQWLVTFNYDLPDDVYESITSKHYLPPMIDKPNQVLKHGDSFFTTLTSKIILGSEYAKHQKHISFDVLNTQSSIAFNLETRVTEVNPVMDEDNLKVYNEQYAGIKDIISDRDFFLTHAYDARSRLYSQGYHVSYQADDYHKACIVFAKKEYIPIHS